ncbi:MAG: hypothetical protein JWM98_2678 [Thermoleophilia bacterium]|nr:hypothetical protein [Thermoleophilia bacterium]
MGRTALVLGAAGIAAATALDVGVDRSRHVHDAPAYRYGKLPPTILEWGGAALLAAGGVARLIPATRGASPTLLRLGAGTLGAFAATLGVRLAIGMLFSPADTGMHWNPGDIARNSVDRSHMMGRELYPQQKFFIDPVSRAQGHGSIDERAARGEFEPMHAA